MRLRGARRVVALFAAVVALSATSTPPASATVAAEIVFEGFAYLSSGLSYPCLPFTTTSPFTKCPLFGWPHGTTTVNGTTVTVPIGGNVRGFTFMSSACLGSAGTFNEPGLPPATAGSCTMIASGVVTGHCGLSQGEGAAFLVLGGTLTPPVPIGFQFQWVGAGGTLWITSDPIPNINAMLVGTAQATPFPQVTFTPLPIVWNSCFDKTAVTFELTGRFSIVDVT